MKIAVVIPTYNRAGTVGRAIESVLAQTLPAEEIIVVDDGSTDETRKAVTAYGGRVRYLYQENRGMSAARNNGVRTSRCAWVAFLDDDDEWVPEKLEKQARALAEVPDAVLCYSALECIDQNGNGTVIQPARLEDVGTVVRLRTPFSPCSVVVRKEAFEAVGGFNERLRGAEDWELFMRLVPNKPLAMVPEPLLIVYTNTASTSMQSDTMLSAELSILETLLEGLHGPSRWIWRMRITSSMYYRAAVSARARGKNCWNHLLRSFLYWPSPLFLPRRYRTLVAAMRTGLRGNGVTSTQGTTESAPPRTYGRAR